MSLQRLNSANSASSGNSALGELTGPAKFEAVTKLLEKLQSDLIKINLLPHQRDAALEELKLYGRNPDNADPIFTKEARKTTGIEILTRHGFNSPSMTTSRNALRCLANALLLRPSTRQLFVDLEYEAKACTRLKNGSCEDEFLVSRIIFLTTYDTNVKLENVIDQHHLAEAINQNLHKHAKLYEKKKLMTDPMEELALTETLKLLFNITHFCPQRSHTFLPAVPWILAIVMKRPLIPNNPMATSMGSLINSMINLDLQKSDDAMHALFPRGEHNSVAERLVKLLSLSIKSYTNDEIEYQVAPLITLMRKVYELAPRDVKVFMKRLVLPSDEDRKQVLGQGSNLPSKLLQLSMSPLAPQAREAISSLLFEMSDKDARNFVHNVGYGFASGFLFQHNVPVPENALEAWSNSNNEDGPSSSNSNVPINPVTGQRLDAETIFEGPEMSLEEKEREAEKLMVLFNRLKQNGVINVENPVEKAVNEGRFQELESDAESD
ncbi:MAG: hypothetical protein M1818_002956 [Claussenomyces sp. TS43310]|nr:MAG: hypothetical protein M1818_002956 [Claussenomyces sp. TS43310]